MDLRRNKQKNLCSIGHKFFIEQKSILPADCHHEDTDTKNIADEPLKQPIRPHGKY